MATATDVKLCVQCKADVTHSKRMKDSQGKYWCPSCAKEDSKKKHTSKVACADCRGKYPPTEVQTIEGEVVCNNCVAARGRHAAGGASSAAKEAAEDQTVRRVKLGLAVASFLGGVVLMLLYFFEYIG